MSVNNETHGGRPVHIIGGGLAGSEAAWACVTRDVPVVIHEMRPQRTTPAHQTGGLAELVCSNSFRADDWQHNAVGLLHEELRRRGSLIMAAADLHRTPAGGALAVDRHGFSAEVEQRLSTHPLVTIDRAEVAGLPPADWDNVIIAAGPLASPALSAAIARLTGEADLAFYDAIAPIVYADSIDMSVAWKQSRYDKGETEAERAAYINCPLSETEYRAFVAALLAGPKGVFKDWEQPDAGDIDPKTPYFSGCMPVETMAESGPETLRFGPMKPVGLTNAHHPDIKPYAVVQLRQDNALGTLYNMVGFQTKLKYAAQTEIFRLIPGLQNAEFARLGGLHRNTFINAPKVLDAQLRLRADPRLRFAGQITGVEGYVESAAIGHIAGVLAACERLGRAASLPAPTTALGALLSHITGGHLDGGRGSFQPMNINYGLFPDVAHEVRGENGKKLPPVERGKAKKRAVAARALADLTSWAD